MSEGSFSECSGKMRQKIKLLILVQGFSCRSGLWQYHHSPVLELSHFPKCSPCLFSVIFIVACTGWLCVNLA